MIYLDNGATSFPKPEGVVEAMTDCLRAYCGNPGRSGHALSRRTGEEVYRARKNIADLLQSGQPERIIFTGNTTQALNLAIKGVVRAGDHVVMTAMEHNSVLRPVYELAAQGVSHTIVPCAADGTLTAARVQEELRENTRLVICTQASNVTGTIMPVAAIARLCRQRDILFLVDAAQSAGHLPVSVENIDMLAAPGHKGLLGPQGTGFLYVREGLTLEPLLAGGTGTASRMLRQPREMPEGYEAGTINAPGIIGLGRAVEIISAIGVAAVRRHEQELTRIFDEELRNIPGVTVYGPSGSRKKAGVTAFNIAGRDCEEVTSLLSDEYGIAMRGGYHCAGLAHETIGTGSRGAVRASVGIYNTAAQMRRAAEAVYRIAREG